MELKKLINKDFFILYPRRNQPIMGFSKIIYGQSFRENDKIFIEIQTPTLEIYLQKDFDDFGHLAIMFPSKKKVYYSEINRATFKTN